MKICFKYISTQRGIGLIELMISMLIGLFVMAGVLQMFSTSSQNAVAASGAARVQENSRYVFTRIAEDISQSGNLGCLSASFSQGFTGNTGDLVENLLQNESGDLEAFDFNVIVYGVQSATAADVPVNSVAAGTDTLHIRFVNNLFKIPLVRSVEPGDTSILLDSSDDDYTADRLNQFDIVALSNCRRVAVFMIGENPPDSGEINLLTGDLDNPSGQQNIRNTLIEGPTDYTSLLGQDTVTDANSQTYLYGGRTGSHIYYVDTSAAARDASQTCNPVDSPQNCALYRRSNSNNPEELVEGVHSMEVWFGWTNANGNLFFSKADGVDDWTQIDRVKVRMDFNSVDGVVTNANVIDQTVDGLLTRRVERTFNLSNQL